MTILAKNEEGLRNIFRLTSIGWTEGFYYKPRVDMDIVREHSEGLVCLSGCGSSRLATMIMEERMEEAIAHAEELRNIFKEDFYIEVQNHGLEWQKDLKSALFRLAGYMDVPTVATQDSHYPSQKDAELHNYICKLSAGDLQFDSDQSWFKSEAEISKMFADEEMVAVSNTGLIAEKCNCDWKHDKTNWPSYDLPVGQTPEKELRDLTWKGFKKLFGEGTQEYRDRIEYELGVIENMGFPTYFLVVQDFINWAKNHDIPVGPGRGSGAGSLVCYCTGITEVDPIKYGLYFERFLNPARVSLPDIDVDFCKDRREEVIQYVASKYGADKIAQIGTYAQFKPRGSVRDFARVCGYEPIVGHQLAALVPPDSSGKQDDWEKIIKNNPDVLRTEWPKVIELARASEGLRNKAGVHAAGVVVSNIPIRDVVPLFLGKHKEVTTQFDMHDVEDIGLVKYDFLGLRNLTVIKGACDLVEEIHGIKLDMEGLEDGDEKTYTEIFQQGRLDGIFQFESSGGFKDLCVKVRPKNIEDLAVITALFRPGPLGTKDADGKSMVDHYVDGRRGKTKKSKYDNEALENILAVTHGVMVYQEQIMKICTDVAGYTLSGADNMRKIIGKKLPEKMKLETEKFIGGCVENGMPRQDATELFKNIEGFADYSFNKAHSVAYSIISYRTAWLKAHYPHEFYTALLNSSMDNTDKMVKNIYAAREDGVYIMPPDINKSHAKFTLDRGTILFGFAGIKGIGEKAIEHLIIAREEKDGFDNIEDVVLAKVKKNVLGALAECGALEEITELSRSGIKEHTELLIKYGKKIENWEARVIKVGENDRLIKEAVADGKKPPRRLPKLKEKPQLEEIEIASVLTRAERLSLERKTLGFYLTGHPLDDYPGLLRLAQCDIAKIKEGTVLDGTKVAIPAVISSITKKRSRKGKHYAVLIIEDQTGRIEATVFARSWEKIKDILEEEQIAILRGRVNQEERQSEDSPAVVRISVNDVSPVEGDLLDLVYDTDTQLNDGTIVTFVPSENQNVSVWQQVVAYIENLRRMG